MKISSYHPKIANADDSRLSQHALPINFSDLERSAHGIVIVGIPDDTGINNVGGRLGAKEAPGSARARLYKFTTGAPKIPVYDLGDVEPEAKIEATHSAAAQVIRAIREAGHFPLVIGGGHDLGFPHALGVLEASEKKTRFINIDAHLDVRPTTNGITSGSPWYLLREHSLFTRTKSRIEEFGLQPHCNAHSLLEYARTHKFGMHWLSDIRKQKRSVRDLFARLLGPKTGSERLLVSLDIDSVQISDAPGCSAPQTLGFSASEAIEMSYAAGAHPRVDSFGIFELSPPLDSDGKTSLLVAHCINACLSGFATRTKVKKS